MNHLEHIAQIDYCYWCLANLEKRLSKPRSAIEAMVDSACGYNEEEEIKKEIISCLEQIIESKKAIGSDCSGDSRFLEQIKNM